MAWGLPLTINDSRYPVIGGVDKRFEKHHRITYATESGETKEVVISRLTATWIASDMILIPTPDDEIAPAFISKSYRRKLLKREKLTAYFLTKLSEFKDKVAEAQY